MKQLKSKKYQEKDVQFLNTRTYSVYLYLVIILFKTYELVSAVSAVNKHHE